MVDRLLTRRNLVFMLMTSIILNIVRMATKITKMEPVDIDIALIVMLLLLFVQVIRTVNKLIGHGTVGIMYASIVMFFNYYIGFSDFTNLILFIPLLLCAIYYFFILCMRFR